MWATSATSSAIGFHNGMRCLSHGYHQLRPALPKRQLCLARGKQQQPRGDDPSSSGNQQEQSENLNRIDTRPVFNLGSGDACSLGTATDAWNACCMFGGDVKEECYADFGVDASRVEKHLDNVAELEASLKLRAAKADEHHGLQGPTVIRNIVVGTLALMALGLLVIPGTVVLGVWHICSRVLEVVHDKKTASTDDGGSELFTFNPVSMCFEKYETSQGCISTSSIPYEYRKGEGLS